jgi:hypothetical protein
MTPGEIQGFAGALIAFYRSNCEKTAAPNRFVMPEEDYIKCAQSNDPSFQIVTRLDYLQQCFSLATANLGRVGEFKILPSAFADRDTAPLNRGSYLLYSKDMDSLVFDLPLGFTTLSFGSLEYLNWKSVAYGQIGSLRLLRPLEFVKFINSNA